MINNTVIEGKKLDFNGKGLNLLGKWLLWLVLGIITLGIYNIIVPFKLKQWEVDNTSILK
ncbi:MAG: hypothetical protein KGV54_00725 [Oceanivirga sp.]|nr:hypothetical protein [Oceanivirga sp.]